MATSQYFGLWSPNASTTYNIPASTAAMQSSVDSALLGVNNYMVGSRSTRTGLTAPRLKKYLRYFETDYNVEWLYTGSGWKRVGGVIPGWTNIRSAVSFQSGWKYSAADNSAAGIKARRVGDLVEIHINNVLCAAKKFKIPTSGDVSNMVVFNGIPAQFRPAAGDYGTVVPGPVGPDFNGYISSSGAFAISFVQPWTTQTGSKDVNRRAFSGKATFMAGSF